MEIGIDILVVRELTGGLLFGTPKSIEAIGRSKARGGYDIYSTSEIERIARSPFIRTGTGEIPHGRKPKVTSMIKQMCSRTGLVRSGYDVGKDYSDVTLEHMLAGTMGNQ